MKCEKCNSEINETMDKCPNCGNELKKTELQPEKKNNKKKVLLFSIITIVVIILVALAILFINNMDKKNKDEVVDNTTTTTVKVTENVEKNITELYFVGDEKEFRIYEHLGDLEADFTYKCNGKCGDLDYDGYIYVYEKNMGFIYDDGKVYKVAIKDSKIKSEELNVIKEYNIEEFDLIIKEYKSGEYYFYQVIGKNKSYFTYENVEYTIDDNSSLFASHSSLEKSIILLRFYNDKTNYLFDFMNQQKVYEDIDNNKIWDVSFIDEFVILGIHDGTVILSPEYKKIGIADYDDWGIVNEKAALTLHVTKDGEEISSFNSYDYDIVSYRVKYYDKKANVVGESEDFTYAKMLPKNKLLVEKDNRMVIMNLNDNYKVVADFSQYSEFKSKKGISTHYNKELDTYYFNQCDSSITYEEYLKDNPGSEDIGGYGYSYSYSLSTNEIGRKIYSGGQCT